MPGDAGVECRRQARAKAKAVSGKLLPRRSCRGLLSISDFPRAVREFLGTGVNSTSGYTTTCTFFSPEQSESRPYPESVEGFDILDVATRQTYEYKGKPLNRLAGPLEPKSSKTQSVIHLHGVGTHAEIVVGKDQVKGLVQVRNDVFTVKKGTVGGMRSLLRRVAHELSPIGK
jgi:hypothetical protein